MVKALISLFTLLLLVTPVLSQMLRDPTQPPAAYTTSGADLNMAEPEKGEVKIPVLQSIVRRHGARPVAMINGQMVRLGGKVDDWTVVRINESDVMLKGVGGKEVLMISPEVEKKPAKAAASRPLQ